MIYPAYQSCFFLPNAIVYLPIGGMRKFVYTRPGAQWMTTVAMGVFRY